MLNSQEVDDIGIGQRVVHVVSHAAAHLLKDTRHQCAWAAEGDVGAELAQGPNVGSRDAAVKNVAEDGDVQAGKLAFLLADGEHVEQRLGGMLMSSVAGVHHVGVEKPREKVRRACCLVADDNDVGIECLQCSGGVLKALALLEGGCVSGEIDNVRA